jgi:hypothetical protein
MEEKRESVSELRDGKLNAVAVMATVATMVAEMANGPLPRLGWCCECVRA